MHNSEKERNLLLALIASITVIIILIFFKMVHPYAGMDFEEHNANSITVSRDTNKSIEAPYDVVISYTNDEGLNVETIVAVEHNINVHNLMVFYTDKNTGNVSITTNNNTILYYKILMSILFIIDIYLVYMLIISMYQLPKGTRKTMFKMYDLKEKWGKLCVIS